MKPATFLPQFICLAFILTVAPCLAQPYIPDSSWWEDRADMNQARAYFPAVAFGDKIYVFGGATSASASTDKIEEYDVESDSWVVKGALPQPMCGMAAVVAYSGAIYIIGGANYVVGGTTTSKVYRYFPETGTFDADTIAPLPTARGFLSACVHDGKIYAMGGWAETFLGTPLSTVEVYDEFTNKWTPFASLNVARAAHTSVQVYDPFWGLTPRIFVIGGTQNGSTTLNSVEMYDFTDPGQGWIPSEPLSYARAGHGSAMIRKEAIYAMGGINPSPVMSVEGFAPDHIGDSWEAFNTMEYDRRFFGCVPSETGLGDTASVFIIGGNSGTSTTLSSTQRLWVVRKTVAVQEASPKPLENPVALLPNTPNPFDQRTELSFLVRRPADIRISIFDATGQLISTLVNGRYGTGEYNIPFEAANLESGIFFCVMNSDNAPPAVQKWVIMRK